MPIANGTFARSTDSNDAYMAWHSGTGTCSDGSLAFANPTPHAACVTGSLFYTPQLTTLCVPSQGPFTGIRPL